MKFFNYSISNPPYQTILFTRDKGVSETQDIYQDFYTLGNKISIITTMIFPGGRWIQKQNKKISSIIYPHITKLEWYEAELIFDTVYIRDGIAITTYDKTRPKNNTILYNQKITTIPSTIEKDNFILPLGKIIPKLYQQALQNNLNTKKYSTNFFGLRTYFVQRNPQLAQNIKQYPTSTFKNPIKALLGNDKQGTSKRIEEYWIDYSLITWTPKRKQVYENYKVIISQAGTNKNPEKQKFIIIDPYIITGEAYTILADFKTLEEAQNFKNYISTQIIRKTLSMAKGGGSKTFGIFTPDLQDYSNNNEIFTPNEILSKDHQFFNKTLEERLYLYYDLTTVDIKDIEI